MKKYLYNGEYIELNTDLEEGAYELDMLTENEVLDDTLELKKIDLNDTLELDLNGDVWVE